MEISLKNFLLQFIFLGVVRDRTRSEGWMASVPEAVLGAKVLPLSGTRRDTALMLTKHYRDSIKLNYMGW